MNILFSKLTLSTITIGSTHAVTTPCTYSENSQIKKFAQEAYYSANTIAERQDHEAVNKELGRSGRGCCPSAILKLISLCAENLINFLVPVICNLSKEEAILHSKLQAIRRCTDPKMTQFGKSPTRKANHARIADLGK